MLREARWSIDGCLGLVPPPSSRRSDFPVQLYLLELTGVPALLAHLHPVSETKVPMLGSCENTSFAILKHGSLYLRIDLPIVLESSADTDEDLRGIVFPPTNDLRQGGWECCLETLPQI